MNLSERRAAAAAAIRAAAADTELVQVMEVDSVAPADIPVMADGLPDASIGTAGTRGPAICAVMADGRAETQAVMLTVYTVARSRLELKLTQTGRGRGLAIVDVVEGALQELPGNGLPPLFVRTTVAALDTAARANDMTARVWITRCAWPPAEPGVPDGQELATPQGGAMGAIRTTVADAITRGMPLLTADDVTADATLADRAAADLLRRGIGEADYRHAIIDRLVPRCQIILQTQRETLGGQHDLAVIANQNWTDDTDRRWTARVAEQEIVATVKVWHRTELLADEAVARVMGQLDQARVAWPGSFDALVLVGGVYVTQRLTGAEYEQLMTLLNRTPAEWDAEQGLMMGMMQCTVQSVTQLRAADESTGAVALQHNAGWR